MKKFLILTLFLSILIFPSWVHADGPYLNIPPTNAFDKIHSQNGTVSAVNFSMPFSIKGFNGINVTSHNSTHTINIFNNATCLDSNFIDETSNRALNTTYHNTSGHALFVYAGISLGSGFQPNNTSTGITLRADPTNPPSTQIADIFLFYRSSATLNNIATDNELSGMIPNGWYYELDSTPLTNTPGQIFLNSWIETSLVNICGAKGATGATGITGPSGLNGNFGTYNETLANNAVINSGGKGINLLNGTGNPVKVVNDPTRNQVNITISNNPTFATRTIDLSSSAYNTVLDNNTGTISITATSKPSSPQFVQTITAGNMPTDTTDVKDYTAVLTVGGKNTNATTSKAISMVATRNGAEVGGTQSVTVTSGNFWESGIYFSASALNSGDKLGLKMWCSSSPCSSGGGLDFRYATIYIIPRQFVNTNNGEMSLLSTGTLLTLSGAVPGVTYSTSVVGQLGQNNFGSVTDSTLGSTSGTIPSFLVTIKGQSLSELTSSREIGDITTTPTAQVASNLMSVQFVKFVRINTLQ